MDLALLDTDTLSCLLRSRSPRLVQVAESYRQEHGRFAFSAITRYEIVRGLQIKNATTQLVQFMGVCNHSLVLPVSGTVLANAADLWVHSRRHGLPRADADLIIAATAISSGRVLITQNTRHFAHLPGLRIANWSI